MQRGPKPKSSHHKTVAGTYRPSRNDRDRAIDPIFAVVGPVVRPPRFLKGRAAKIWRETIAIHAEWSPYRLDLLMLYSYLKAEMVQAPADCPMNTTRMVELRRLSEMIFAPREVNAQRMEPDDPLREFFND